MTDPGGSGIIYTYRELLAEIKDDIRAVRQEQTTAATRLGTVESDIREIKTAQENAKRSRAYLITTAIALVMAITAVIAVMLQVLR